ncbi:MAG TPA: flagellar filament capping protein FliD, partial [Tissierellaceae bacterium]
KSIKHKDESGEEVKGSGIKATIVDGRLVLEDSKTGEREISILDKEGSEGFSELFKSTNPKYGLQKGQQAKFSVNGIDVVKDSNTINDVIEGVVLNIKQKTDKTETITVGQDFEKIEKAVKDFVDQYNSTMNFINSKLDAGDPEVVGSKGDLAGDGSLMRLQKSLRSLVTAKMGSQTTIKDISELGVSTKDRHGDLVFDSSKLKAFMKDDPSAVKEFFTNKSEDNKSTGYIERLNSTIDQFISTKNGIIKTKNESFDRALKDLNRQIETFNERMERKEKQYIKMFSALDVAMMKGESQMSWLEGQINAMNGQRK